MTDMCDVPDHVYLVSDLRATRAERDALRREAHDLRVQLEAWLRRFGVDPDNADAVRRLRDDLRGFYRWRGRQVSGKERISDVPGGTGTVAHYEAKLAAKKAQIHQLEARIRELSKEKGKHPC